MRIPPATQALLWALGIAFLLQNVLGDSAGWLALWPTPTGLFRPWQLLTYGFLHGGMGHLFFNALALFQFGPSIEQAWGSRRFAIYFLASVAGSGLIQLIVALLLRGELHPVIGASGGIFAVLLAYAVLFPHQRLMLLIPPIPMRARTLVILYGIASLAFGLTGTVGGIAHFVHLGGIVVGWLLIRFWLMPKRGGPRPPSTYV
jgi:membrane associated rhomboid family serine protease